MSNPLASELARWESEGGTTSADIGSGARQAHVLSPGEERILQCLGAALLLQWNDLPTSMQKELFEHAVTMGEANEIAQIKERIARFLHLHKDDEESSA